MAEMKGTVTITVRLALRGLSLWTAIKLRIAGGYEFGRWLDEHATVALVTDDEDDA